MSLPGVDRLTARQRQVLRLTALGLPQKVIAELLGITVQTVKNHVTLIYRQLDAHCLVDALREVGWLRVPEE